MNAMDIDIQYIYQYTITVPVMNDSFSHLVVQWKPMSEIHALVQMKR